MPRTAAAQICEAQNLAYVRQQAAPDLESPGVIPEPLQAVSGILGLKTPDKRKRFPGRQQWAKRISCYVQQTGATGLTMQSETAALFAFDNSYARLPDRFYTRL